VARTDLLAVLTTIHPPTACAARLSQALARVGGRLLVVGDRKGPERFDLPCTDFISFADQRRLPFALARLLPADHYVRKNLGYLLAISRGAGSIYETDDDNMPNDAWRPRALVTAARAAAARPWLNVYRAFSDRYVWPRGFPLERVSDPAGVADSSEPALVEVTAPVQQGLADGAPDVDAVWRLVLPGELSFTPGPSVWLPPGTWCPFNSQSTWWWPAAYPLLYLPAHCSFRMTDIWRGFVAQRCLWELGCGLVFHAAEVVQHRNVHNLLRDFQDEVPGYLNNARIAERLSGLRLTPGPGAVADNLLRCYEDLVAGGILPREELALVRAWVEDLHAVAGPVREAA
jgi:hypothetical protein